MIQFLPFDDVWLYTAMAALVLTAAFLQGVGGVGFAMFAAPIAAIYYPALVPGPLLTLGGFVSLLTALRERRDIVWPSAGAALSGRTIGTLIAVYAMAQLSARPLSLLFAAFILIAVMLSWAGLTIHATTKTVGVAGILSGVMGTITSVGAPPLAIALQHTPPANLRATLGTVLFCGSLFSLLMLSLTDHYGLHEFTLSLTLLPFMLMGFMLSNRIRHRVSQRMVRRVLLGVCALSAVGLAIRTLWWT